MSIVQNTQKHSQLIYLEVVEGPDVPEKRSGIARTYLQMKDIYSEVEKESEDKINNGKNIIMNPTS